MPVDTCPTVITKWILEGFPKVAHVDDVRQCLDQNGFDEVEILEKSKKSTHTHCLEVSLCLEGLFLPSVSLSILSSKTHPTSMALCALVANWPNEMHLPPALGRYIPCQCTYLLRQKASFFATKPASLLDPKCNQS